ncbi:MAG: exodeoxyribonuclease III [Desulfarculus sp.]|nr:exodeoxyribonuclease III [Pseudomonadota bacterium]MBV1716286.1 exodeoxyribonuclease III [Desulfarculus sp.]MBU4574055.1 exodeoxyribonuclease III [Pseudomonadota bacterium]MBU4599368.1 exodeoxyribonuclease III [Pseudomonadota bacterium]MBV1737248.1 exodeoxyribonuclease III [Desulfarculus sp.]
MPWSLATFNVNGVRARLPLLLDWLKKASPEVACLQETKVVDEDFPADAFTELGYHAYFHGQKSFNGVAILTRQEAAEVVQGLEPGDGGQARVLAVRLATGWVVNLYVPQGREVGHEAWHYKLEFLDQVARMLPRRFNPKEPVIVTGDMNVAPTDLDVYDPKRMAGKVSCHPDERAALERIEAWGLTDLFRQHHPEAKQFTFWDYRLPQSFKRDLGWRIDLILATAPLAEACGECLVDTEPRGLPKPSDHTPVLAKFA